LPYIESFLQGGHKCNTTTNTRAWSFLKKSAKEKKNDDDKQWKWNTKQDGIIARTKPLNPKFETKTEFFEKKLIQFWLGSQFVIEP
jgi:hypothetical protein